MAASHKSYFQGAAAADAVAKHALKSGTNARKITAIGGFQLERCDGPRLTDMFKPRVSAKGRDCALLHVGDQPAAFVRLSVAPELQIALAAVHAIGVAVYELE